MIYENHENWYFTTIYILNTKNTFDFDIDAYNMYYGEIFVLKLKQIFHQHNAFLDEVKNITWFNMIYYINYGM